MIGVKVITRVADTSLATLYIHTDDPTGPHQLSVTGAGAEAQLEISPPNYDFTDAIQEAIDTRGGEMPDPILRPL